MLHPIFSTVVSRPDLVVDHLSAYVALASEEAAATGQDLKRRAIAWAIAGVCALLAIVFGGVAAMLGVLHGRFHWVLALVPGVMLLAALLAALAGRSDAAGTGFNELRRQVTADIGLLRAHAGADHGR